MLPKDYQARKALPMYDFLTGYFPDAIVEIVKVAVAGNVQHNPGEPLHWAREKSTDQMNTAMRHIFDHGMGNVYDQEPPEILAAIGGESTMHLAKAAWRLMAQIQLICEARQQGSNPVPVAAVPGAPAQQPEQIPAALKECSMCGRERSLDGAQHHQRWCEHHPSNPKLNI